VSNITTADLLDRERLQELRSLDGEESFLDDLIELFKTESLGSLSELGIAIAAIETHTAKSIAHRIKGASASLGAKRMASLAGSLELAEIDEMPVILHELRQVYESTITELTNL
jgi:HPt (histidine-containing phosphotransfer) domain-containing protein